MGQVCKPKKEVSLGIIKFRIFNLALLTKWWWMPIASPQSMIVSLLVTMHGPRRGIWHAKPRNSSNTSVFWKRFSPSRALLWHSVLFKLGKENKIAFWYNQWCLQIPLKFPCSTLFELTQDKDAGGSKMLAPKQMKPAYLLGSKRAWTT